MSHGSIRGLMTSPTRMSGRRSDWRMDPTETYRAIREREPLAGHILDVGCTTLKVGKHLRVAMDVNYADTLAAIEYDLIRQTGLDVNRGRLALRPVLVDTRLDPWKWLLVDEDLAIVGGGAGRFPDRESTFAAGTEWAALDA